MAWPSRSHTASRVLKGDPSLCTSESAFAQRSTTTVLPWETLMHGGGQHTSMRALALLIVALLAGCTSGNEAPAEAVQVDVLGSIVSPAVETIPATAGGEAAPALVVGHAATQTRAATGSAVSLPLTEGGASLRLVNHGDFVRTSLRWSDADCVVTMRTPSLEQVRDDARLSVDNAVTPASPYVQYSFSGACSGDVFVLWRG